MMKKDFQDFTREFRIETWSHQQLDFVKMCPGGTDDGTGINERSGGNRQMDVCES